MSAANTLHEFDPRESLVAMLINIGRDMQIDPKFEKTVSKKLSVQVVDNLLGTLKYFDDYMLGIIQTLSVNDVTAMMLNQAIPAFVGKKKIPMSHGAIDEITHAWEGLQWDIRKLINGLVKAAGSTGALYKLLDPLSLTIETSPDEEIDLPPQEADADEFKPQEQQHDVPQRTWQDWGMQTIRSPKSSARVVPAYYSSG
jgi:hypothetical protein